MLLAVNIRDLALIDEVQLEFGPGLNVLTGETGAGKSIIIDALGLVLGARASAELVRTGAEVAVVEALFDVGDRPAVTRALTELGVDPGESLLVCREVQRSGRSLARVNGRLVSAGMLRELAALLVDVHGQHEHQSLLSGRAQLEALDACGGSELAQARDEFTTALGEHRRLRAALDEVAGDARQRARRLDLLRYELDELQRAALRPDEDIELARQQRLLANAERLSAAAARAYDLLYGGSSERPAGELLGAAAGELAAAARLDPVLDELVKALEELGFQLEAVVDRLRRYRNGLDYEPAAVEAVESRLDLLSRLRRKYGDTVAEMLAYAQQAAAEIQRLEGAEALAERLEGELAVAGAKLTAAAAELSRRRRLAATELDRRLERELRELGMPDARFVIELGRDEDPQGLEVEGVRVSVRATGIDRVQFLIAPNPGEPPRGLARIASGGELARVMLGLRSVLAQLDDIPTLIFDEIDAGIGGLTARKVAEKLARVARSRQVLCVTHLAHIAAFAHRHLVVVKEAPAGRAITSVRPLADGERPREIARMLGVEYSGTGARHASELLAEAQRVM